MHTKSTDVVIHIDEELDDARIHELEQHLAGLEGVYSACVNDRARHLLLVDYDPDGLRAQDLLYLVEERGVHAELIGL
jgi:hypothetical protein